MNAEDRRVVMSDHSKEEEEEEGVRIANQWLTDMNIIIGRLTTVLTIIETHVKGISPTMDDS